MYDYCNDQMTSRPAPSTLFPAPESCPAVPLGPRKALWFKSRDTEAFVFLECNSNHRPPGFHHCHHPFTLLGGLGSETTPVGSTNRGRCGGESPHALLAALSPLLAPWSGVTVTWLDVKGSRRADPVPG